MTKAVRQVFEALDAHKQALEKTSMRALFAQDPDRFSRYHLQLDDLIFDFSKQRVNDRTLELFEDLAKAAQVEEKRAALLSGAIVNPTEQRAAMHMALRNFSAAPVPVAGADGDPADVMPEVRKVRSAVLQFAEAVRSGAVCGVTGAPFTDIVNIGIGGSDLGPAMAARALTPYALARLRTHFVSNVDGADLGDLLPRLDPARTLFIISSKTFTTQETMTNAASARRFIAAALGEAAVADHFAAVSTQRDKVAAFGIRPDRVFGFWNWVGGRYSVWSAIGLALAISIGADHFEAFLRGAHDVDQHFATAPILKNIPVMMALLGVFRRNVWKDAALAVIPYDQRLARLPAYLQQLDMESNGKSVTVEGAPVDCATGPIIFGEPGTNSQHAFFQLLHQGVDITPIDFLVAAEPTQADAAHHALLFANCLAQSEALMRGRTLEEVEAILARQGVSAQEIAALAPHKVFAGDRPSSTFLYRALTPRTLGRLLALYEHKVFVQAAIWSINPFDQWGVELGKELCARLAPIVTDKAASTAALDASTAGLIEARRRLSAHGA